MISININPLALVAPAGVSNHTIGIKFGYSDTDFICVRDIPDVARKFQRDVKFTYRNSTFFNAERAERIEAATNFLDLLDAMGEDAFNFCPDCGANLREVFRRD